MWQYSKFIVRIDKTKEDKMASIVKSFAISGVEGYPVDVEVKEIQGQPMISILGFIVANVPIACFQWRWITTDV